jgi:hypothetical protein
MKKMFTKLFGTALLTGLLMTGITVKAQTSASGSASATKDAAKITSVTNQTAKPADPVDTSFHPVRRIWGYTFGDFYYAAQAPALVAAPGTNLSSQGKETNYAGVPGGRNAFQFRRIYLGYDYDIDKRFSVQLLLASEPAANTGTLTGLTTANGDNLVDGN